MAFVDELIGIAGIMALLGISKARAHQLTHKPDFPPPAATIDGRARGWRRADVEAWARQTGRIK